MSRATGRHTRPKKLTPKQNVQIFREEQVETLVDYDSTRPQVETGVDKSEESEYHLQQAIKANEALKRDEKIKEAYIPTPPTISSDIQYDVLYPKGWQQPATYIRSSATVEDCSGISYCMDEEDEVALKIINGRLPSGVQSMSEDQFEEIMNAFEENAQIKQPYAAVDSPPVLSLDELLNVPTEEVLPTSLDVHKKVVYEHWRARRTNKQNHTLTPKLKSETGQESDDADPYVCFRRRELRQIRKTRNRDAQSVDKLRKLRTELESARNMLLIVKQREQQRKDQLDMDRTLFEHRHLFKETKRKLGIKGDDDLLVNQKKQKLPPPIDAQQAALAHQLSNLPMRAGQSDLRTLEDVRAERQHAIENEINTNVEKHIRWNEGFVDKTKTPLTPVDENVFNSSGLFLEAMPATEYLPTPPASISEDEGETAKLTGIVDIEMKDASMISTPFRYASPAEDDCGPAMPSFRRRIGRGGRIVIDRRIPSRPRRDTKAMTFDKFKFDYSDDDDDDDDIIDQDNIFADDIYRRMQERALLLNRSSAETTASNARKAQVDAGNALHGASMQKSPGNLPVT